MSDLITYPEIWKEKELSEISSLITDGAHFSPVPQEHGEMIANVKDMKDSGINYDGCTRILKSDFEFLARQSCSPKNGDVLLSKDGTIGKVVLYESETPVVLLSSIAIIRLEKEVWPDYIKHVLKSFIFDKQLYALQSGSALKRIVLADIKKLKITLPEFDQQQKIAKILSTVDNLIEKTQSLIEKYTAIKQGMMADLFTRGIDMSTGDTPNSKGGKLRPSVEDAPELYKQTELGWVPKEWEVVAIDEILDRVIDYRGKTPTKTDEGVPLITAKNVRFGYVDPEPREFIAFDAYEHWMTRGIPKKGDVLFTTEAPLANVAQIESDERIAFAQRMIILQTSKSCDNMFLKHLLMSETFRKSIFSRGSGSTVEGVKQSEFKKVLVKVPKSTEEQKLIVNSIESVVDKISAERKANEKYKKQKKGLMQDLLTGKVKVK